MASGRAPVGSAGGLREVSIDAVPLARLAPLLDTDRAERLRVNAARARAVLGGRTIWNVNTTASGGGVAEMLQSLLAYTRGAGVDTRWVVMEGPVAFFQLTKRLHNRLHGMPGDDGATGATERALYEGVLAENLERLAPSVRAGDIVLLHDPQTAGLAPGLRAAGVHVVWRCHVGRDTANELTDQAWAFLRPYVVQAEAAVFSRDTYAPPWVDPGLLWVIPPSLDPFSAKNRPLARPDVDASLSRAGLLRPRGRGGRLGFVRRDGTPGAVRRHEGLLEGGPLSAEVRVVVQISRWDRLKDMAGVLGAFAAHATDLPDDTHLLLVGPDSLAVSDDPDGSLVLAECRDLWHAQPLRVRRRSHLCSLPMDDVDENAHLVNALQRHASVVVQKSLVEGFGLTVAEAMWKSRPVVATRVGGIQDQVVHGESGLLLDDPADLDGLAAMLLDLLRDVDRAERLGVAAHDRVREHFLADRHLGQYVDLLVSLGAT